MKHSTRMIRALLAGVFALTIAASAQQKPHGTMTTDLAATLSFERAQVAQVNGNRFWLKGGSLDGAVTFFKGFGVAANLTGEHAANIQNNVSLGKVAFMAGPRYTIQRVGVKKHPARVFGEALFGGVHAFDSVFPATTAATSSAGAFSMQMGGGIDVGLAKGFGVRALELDYVHTSLPNNGSNTQNDLRVGFGLSYRR